MKIRWLGNACIEVSGDRQLLIDPNFLVEPEKFPELVLVTHEHDDHFSPEKCEDILPKATVYAPRETLEKCGLKGIVVEAGDRIDSIRVLESYCWGTEESVSYFYEGLLHAGDSAEFPEVEDVKLVFTACFPDYYKDYVRAFRRLSPELVVPFHYDAEEDLDKAMGLKERCDEEGINCRLMKVGDEVEI